jgi:ABC-2 type transport system permease protein
VPPAWVLGAQLAINLVLALAAILATAALFAMGMWVAAIARTAKASGAVGMALFSPLLSFAGLWVPRQLMPPPLPHTSDFTPLGAAVQSLQATYQGTFPPAGPLLVLAADAVIFGFLAVRLFSRE